MCNMNDMEHLYLWLNMTETLLKEPLNPHIFDIAKYTDDPVLFVGGFMA